MPSPSPWYPLLDARVQFESLAADVYHCRLDGAAPFIPLALIVPELSHADLTHLAVLGLTALADRVHVGPVFE